VGNCALVSNTSGFRNTAVGNNALRSNTTGYGNIAMGAYASCGNTTAGSNVAIGYSALRSNTTGTHNVAIGRDSQYCSNGGLSNVSMGRQSLRCNITGQINVAIGTYALRLTTGTANTAVGNFANSGIISVNGTIAIGNVAATSGSDNHTVWGNSSNNACNCVYAAWATVSDCRDKTNIQTLPSKLGLDLIKKLRPVSFNWDHRDTYVRECKYEYGTKDGNLASTKEHYGLIAQELKSTLEELNIKFDGLGHDTEKDAYRVTYEELIPSMIKAIQEQQVEIETLKDTLQRHNIS
jgi:hypothetical protein